MVTDLPSDENNGGGGKSRPSPISRYGEVFEEKCGYYMSLGMSYHDYWDGDNCMTKYYREAEEIKIERRNSELHLQAAYIYEALLDASPALNPLSKRKKPFPFRSEPIPITHAGHVRKEEQKKRKMLENGKEAMRAMMVAINERFNNKEKGGEVKNA